MTKKRDAAYFMKRLEKEHPALFAQVCAKKLSVRAASAKAGLIRLPSRLDALQREWRGASDSERREFLKWLKSGGRAGGKMVSVADAAGRLSPAARIFLRDWLKREKSRAGRIMKEIGFAGFDWTLSSAIEHGSALRPEVIPRLADWLSKRGFVRPR